MTLWSRKSQNISNHMTKWNASFKVQYEVQIIQSYTTEPLVKVKARPLWSRLARPKLKHERKKKKEEILINTNLVFRDEVIFHSVSWVKMSKTMCGVTFEQSHGGWPKTIGPFFEPFWRKCGKKKVPAEWPNRGREREGGTGAALSRSLQGYVAEEVGHGLAVVGSPDRLGQDHGDVDDLEEVKREENKRLFCNFLPFLFLSFLHI